MGVLKIRDETGAIKEILVMRGPQGPAGTGTGDMTAVVYDPTGQAQDIFKYADQVGVNAGKSLAAHNNDGKAHDDIRQAIDASVESHNGNDAAHGDIRQAVSDAALAASAARSLANTKASTKTITATVTNTWTASGNHFCQNISLGAVRETDNPIVDVLTGSDNDANLLYEDAFSKVFRIIAGEGYIQVWAKEAIATAFPIQLKVVR